MKHDSPIRQHYEELVKLCRQFGVEKLYAFGSAQTEDFDEIRSDIDLIAELRPMDDPIEKGETLMNLWDELEALFSRKVDLLTDQPISNPYLKRSVEKTKRLIYDRKSQEISF